MVNSSTEGDFSFGTRLGLVFIIEAAFCSLIAVLSLLSWIVYSAVKVKRNAQKRWDITTPLHIYFLSMLVAETIQATGSIMDMKWVIDANVVLGSYCETQGILKQIGDVSVALSTLAISIHTFRAIVFRWGPEHPTLTASLGILAIWITIILIMGISAATHMNKNYWGDTSYWCWIRPTYPVQQIVLDYLFMWVTAFVNIVLYIPLALVIKGVIIVNGYKVRFAQKDEKLDKASSVTQASKGVDAIAMQMLFYPLIYTITVLPIAIVRFRQFHDQHVPFEATVFADVLFSCSGLFNVILFTLTRPSLLPRRDSTLPTHAMSFSLRSRQADELMSYPGRTSTIMFNNNRLSRHVSDDNLVDDGAWQRIEEIRKDDPSYASSQNAH